MEPITKRAAQGLSPLYGDQLLGSLALNNSAASLINAFLSPDNAGPFCPRMLR
jgi:hypothetical protein